MKKVFIMTAAVVIVASAAGVALANIGSEFSNMEKHQVMIEKKAEILGLDAEELASKLAEGKTFRDMSEDKGVTGEGFVEKKFNWMQQRLDVLVERGRITSEQADEKLASIQERMENCANDFDGVGKTGMGRIGGGKMRMSPWK